MGMYRRLRLVDFAFYATHHCSHCCHVDSGLAARVHEWLHGFIVWMDHCDRFNHHVGQAQLPSWHAEAQVFLDSNRSSVRAIHALSLPQASDLEG